MSKGFTLVELVVVIAIISVLSGIILFSVTQYINTGKDSNISGNLAVLVPAGEAFYNLENTQNGDGYNGYCDPAAATGSVLRNALSQMPENPDSICYCDPIRTCPSSYTWTATSNPAGVCCAVAPLVDNYQSWAACAKEFAKVNTAYCVDSRGIKKEIPINLCVIGLHQCPED